MKMKALRLHCVPVVFGLMLACSAHAQSLDPSLKLHFTFEDDFTLGRVTDVTGNGHDGLRFQATNWISVTNGIFATRGGYWHTNSVLVEASGAVVPVSQYLAVTNLSGILYLTNATISVWAQFGEGSGTTSMLLDAGYPVIYSPQPMLASNSWSLRRDFGAFLIFTVFDATAYKRTIVRWPTDVVRAGGMNPNYSTTNVHHYAVTLNCLSDQAVAYYDGRPYQTNAIGVPWLRIYSGANQNWLAVGRMIKLLPPEVLQGNGSYAAGFFDGRMDELRIYDRALQPSEIADLYYGHNIEGLAQPRPDIHQIGSQAVELCWSAQSNILYQVEYKGSLSTNLWGPLGAPILGSGTTKCWTDSVSGKSKGYYRLRALP